MRVIVLVLVSLSYTIVPAQDDTEDANFLDFWVGEWNAQWDGGGGTNSIKRILNDSVIQENFSITHGQGKGFLGISISAFDKKKKVWRQAWADSSGGFLSLVGRQEDDKKIFETLSENKNQSTAKYRMVFSNIKENSFSWDWMSSKDGGKSWEVNWRIHYERTR